MLGKLIKNEFKSSVHSVMNIYIAAVVAIAVMLLSYAVKVTWVGVIGSIALIVIGLICVVVTLVAVVTNFNRTLYGAEGYLSYTLPVKSSALLTSKGIVSFVWVLLSYLFMIATFFIVLAYLQSFLGEQAGGTMDMFMTTAGLPSVKAIGKALVVTAVGMFIQIAVFVAAVFFALTVSNIRPFQRFGIFTALAVFLLIYIVMQILLYVTTSYIPLTVVIDEAGKVAVSFSASMAAKGAQQGMVIGIAGFVIELLIAAGLFVGTNALMKTRVNIK